MDRVAVGDRVVEPLEHDDADAGARRACRARRRRTAGSARRARGSSLLRTDSRSRCGKLIDTPPASAMSHSPRCSARTRQLHRDERGRARGLHDDARPAQIELVRHARREKVLVVAEHQLIAADRRDELRIREQLRDEVGRSCSQPANTPIDDPARLRCVARVSRAPPTRSRGRGAAADRCICASRGEKPKNAASNRSASSSTVPRLHVVARASAARDRRPPPPSSSSVNVSSDSTPARRFAQNASRSRAPGKRPLMPMIAIGDCAEERDWLTRRGRGKGSCATC